MDTFHWLAIILRPQTALKDCTAVKWGWKFRGGPVRQNRPEHTTNHLSWTRAQDWEKRADASIRCCDVSAPETRTGHQRIVRPGQTGDGWDGTGAAVPTGMSGNCHRWCESGPCSGPQLCFFHSQKISERPSGVFHIKGAEGLRLLRAASGTWTCFHAAKVPLNRGIQGVIETKYPSPGLSILAGAKSQMTQIPV